MMIYYGAEIAAEICSEHPDVEVYKPYVCE
jgi:hypothetical protein